MALNKFLYQPKFSVCSLKYTTQRIKKNWKIKNEKATFYKKIEQITHMKNIVYVILDMVYFPTQELAML